jgi:hypothetical protein
MTWFFVLFWMRRPWMKKLHLFPMARMNEEKGRAYYEKYKQQNRFARKIGLPTLQVVFFLFVASILIQITLLVALRMNDQGWLTPPKLEGKRVIRE